MNKIILKIKFLIDRIQYKIADRKFYRETGMTLMQDHLYDEIQESKGAYEL